MFRVQNNPSHCRLIFYYFSPQWELSNNLSSDPNWGHMQTFHPWEADVPTYHFGVHKTITFSTYRVIFRVHHSQRHGICHFYSCTSWWYLSNKPKWISYAKIIPPWSWRKKLPLWVSQKICLSISHCHV